VLVLVEVVVLDDVLVEVVLVEVVLVEVVAVADARTGALAVLRRPLPPVMAGGSGAVTPAAALVRRAGLVLPRPARGVEPAARPRPAAAAGPR
jgi:hypothetical protein